MNQGSLAFLGRAAAAFRRAGLQPLLALGRDGLDALFQFADYPPLSAQDSGVRVHGFLRHRSFLADIARGYEPATKNLFVPLVAAADYFIDAGAHIGWYSLLAGRYGPPAQTVLAFEPDPYNQHAFRFNMRRSRRRNVTLYPAAVSDSAGSAPMLISDGTIGSSLVLERTRIGGTRVFPVRTVALDALLESAQPIESKAFLIKLDVEGAELRALKGLQSTMLHAGRVALICEVNPEALEAGGKYPKDLISILRGAGLAVHFISEAAGGLIPADEASRAKGNFLAVRNWPLNKDWFRA